MPAPAASPPPRHLSALLAVAGLVGAACTPSPSRRPVLPATAGGAAASEVPTGTVLQAAEGPPPTVRTEVVGDPVPARTTAAALAPSPPPARPDGQLLAPRVVLQARAGAGGGNPNRIDMRGATSIYVDAVADQPLDFSSPPDRRDDAVVFVEGGWLPGDRAFVVTNASWSGTSAGDTNGYGGFELVVAGETLVDEGSSKLEHRGAWSGLLRILPGEESRTYLEVRNTSSGDVLLTGFFEDLERR